MKRTVALLLVIVLVLSTAVFAAETRAQPASLSLSFNGTTATCDVFASASNMNHSM